MAAVWRRMAGIWRWRCGVPVVDDRRMTYAIDPELAPWLDMVPSMKFGDHAALLAARATIEQLSCTPHESASRVDIRQTMIPGPDAEVPVLVHRRAVAEPAAPGLLYIHGGGFVMSDLRLFSGTVLRVADELGVVVVAVEYRLAPEHPFPAPLEDCYAVLSWMIDNAAELGIDPARVGVLGESAGGGLAAGLALLARDRGGPRLCFQFLEVPELDDRLGTPSMRAHHNAPLWDQTGLVFGWRCYLGVEPGSAGVSPYAAPGRAENLAGLPPACVVVSQFDPLRDEGIAYAQQLMLTGIPTELHCYAGTLHDSSLIEHAAVTRRMRADQLAALRRGLAVSS
jgi:acetyl esterase